MMRSDDDEALLRRYARSGDEAAFRELVRRHGGLVYAACLREVRRPDLAEDAAQSVFLDLARKAARIRVGGSLVPWLYAAAKHAGRSVLRAERRRPTVPLEDSLPAASPQDPDDALFEALDALNSSEREAIVLRFIQGFSFAEVGQAQGVSEDAARMRVQRALKRLRTEYVPVLAPPASLTARLASLALPKAAPLMNTPLLFAAIGLASAATATAVILRPTPQTPSSHSPASGRAVARRSVTGSPFPASREPAKPGTKASRAPTIDKPFTLAYHYVERDLRSPAMREAAAKEVRRQLTPYVDQDKMSPESLEEAVSTALNPRPTFERDVTLSFDGTTLYVNCLGGGQPETFLVRQDRTYEFPGPPTEGRSPICDDAYRMFVIPYPIVGPSLPYLPVVRGDGWILDPEGAPGKDGKPWYNPGRLETKDGKVMRILQSAPGVKRPYAVATLSNHRNVNGFSVAGSIVYRESTPKGPTKTRTFTLTSASGRPLSADRFVPESYLPERTDFFVSYRRQGKSFTYERSRGPLDDQIAEFLAGGAK